MSAHVLLNLLNELRKRDQTPGLPRILSLFHKELKKFNNTSLPYSVYANSKCSFVQTQKPLRCSTLINTQISLTGLAHILFKQNHFEQLLTF